MDIFVFHLDELLGEIILSKSMEFALAAGYVWWAAHRIKDIGFHTQALGKSLYGHSGTIPGYSGTALHNPSHGYTITVLSNVSTLDQMAIYGDLQKVILSYMVE